MNKRVFSAISKLDPNFLAEKKLGQRCHNCIYWDNKIMIYYYIPNRYTKYKLKFYYAKCNYMLDIGEVEDTCFYSAYLDNNIINVGMNFCCMHWSGKI